MRNLSAAAMAILLATGALCARAEAQTSRPSLPDNQWVAMNEPPMGVQLLGWDEVRYAPELDGILFYGAFRSFTSENQNAIWLYRFRENRWRLLHLNLFFIRDEMTSDGGHTSGRMVFDRARKVLVYQGLCSMSRNDRFRTWVFDPFALVGWDANPTSSPGMEYDGACAWLPEAKASFAYKPSSGSWAYDSTANQWKKLCPPGKGGPAPTGDVVYDPKRNKLWGFGGAGGEYSGKSYKTFNGLWAFDLSKNEWEKVETKDPPPGRAWPQMAISPAADVMLVTGGLSGERTPQGNSVVLKDTWVLHLDTLEWEPLDKAPAVGACNANHLAYDPANDVFLYVSAPPRHLGYGYQCGVWALKYRGKKETRPEPSAVIARPAYDLAALPKPSGEWMPLGGGAVSAVKGWAFRPSLAARGDELLLAFGEYDPPGAYQHEGCYVHAFKFAAGQWTRLGNAAASELDAHSQTPSACFDEAGKPVVAFQSIKPWKPVELPVRRFDGEWKSLASPTAAKQQLDSLPALCGGAGALAIAFQNHPDFGKGMAIRVSELGSDGWKPAGDGKPLNVIPPANARAQFASLVRDGKGRLIAAWQEQQAGYNGENATPERIHVKRLENGEWTELKRPPPATTQPNRELSFAMTLHKGEPVLAICEGATGDRAKLRVMAWTSDSWADVGGWPLNVLGADSGALRPALASDGQSLYVAWSEFLPNRPPLLFVKEWDGAKWSLIGGPLNAASGKGAAHHPALAILNGKPVVAWTEHDFESDTLRQLFVRVLK